MTSLNPDQRNYWPRLREAAKPYDGMPNWGTEMLADVLAYLYHQSPPAFEVALAQGLHKAGVKVATGRLRIEQDLLEGRS